MGVEKDRVGDVLLKAVLVVVYFRMCHCLKFIIGAVESDCCKYCMVFNGSGSMTSGLGERSLENHTVHWGRKSSSM